MRVSRSETVSHSHRSTPSHDSLTHTSQLLLTLTITPILTADDVTARSDGDSDLTELTDDDDDDHYIMQRDDDHDDEEDDEYHDDLYEEPSRVKRAKIESKGAKSTTKSKGKGRAGVDRLSTLPFELVAMVSQT